MGIAPRRFRNGLGLAVPDKRQIEALRRAARYLLAVDRVEAKRQQLRLSRDQTDQLKERRRTEQAAAEASIRELYSIVLLPRVENGQVVVDRVEKGGRPLQSMGLHERVMELLTAVGTRKVHNTLTARKVIERVKLGIVGEAEAAKLGVPVRDVVEAFFAVVEPPRLASAEAIGRAIAQGIAEGVVAYPYGPTPELGVDGRFAVNTERLVLDRSVDPTEIDFETGFIMLRSAAPERPGAAEGRAPEPTPEPRGEEVQEAHVGPHTVRLTFRANRDQVFKAFSAIANLAERSDGHQVRMSVEATSGDGYDPVWFRNAVEEPLDEADVQRESFD